jgi:hypothetical protein
MRHAFVLVGTGKAGRAVPCPPSGVGGPTNLALLSCGGQGDCPPYHSKRTRIRLPLQFGIVSRARRD